MSGLYFTFRSADASSKSAQETKQAAETQAERQARAEVGQAVRLMASKEPVSSTAGLYVVEELLDQEHISQALAYKLITLYVKHNAASPFETNQNWRTMSDEARSARIDSRTIGIGSLEKRAGDIQFALDALSANDKVRNERGLYTPRIDLRDLHLEGAALGHAKLQGALFRWVRNWWAPGTA